MNKSIASMLAVAASLAVAQSSFATVLYSEDFNSYANGNLTNGTTWFQTGSSVVNLIQVSGGTAVLANTGQDVYSPLSSVYSIPDGTSLYFGLTINVNAANAAGDYFFHFDPIVGDSSAFFGRVFIKSSGAGFVLGYLETSGTGGVVNYGGTELAFGTAYNLVLSYDNVAGALNDTASLYVNPTDPLQANNTAYISLDPWTTVTAENHNVGEINLRQGTAANAPSLTVDNIIVATSFSDIVAAPVPEPSSIALAALGGGACLLAFRRKR